MPRPVSGARVRGTLAALSCLFLWSQFVAAAHVHTDGLAGGGQPEAYCELCIVHGSAALPLPASVTPVVPPVAPDSLGEHSVVPLLSMRHAPHAPRAPPSPVLSS